MTATLEPLTTVARSAGSATAPAPRRGRVRRIGGWFGAHAEQVTLFAVFYAAYTVIGAVLLFHYGSTAHDAVSRVDDASNVLFSNDKHLAAIGFVWNPLPSLLEMPLLLFKHFWPALLAKGYASNLESAGFMAGAVVGVRGILADRGAGFWTRMSIPLLLAVHPFIAEYGANGMSEAFFLFFMVLATRSLLRYVDRHTPSDVLIAGIWLGFGYLCRYEAAAAGLGATALVAVVAFQRGGPTVKRRLQRSAVDLTLMLAPFLLAFGGWSLLSLIIVGHPFEQFSSAYGNSGFIAADHNSIVAATGQGTSRALPYAIHQMLALEPLTAVIVGLAIVVAVMLSSWRPIVPLAVFVPILAFALVAFLAGETYGWLRFYIMEIPLAVCAIATIVPVRGLRKPGQRILRRGSMALGRGVVVLAGIALLAPSLYTGTRVYYNASLAREEHSEITDVLHGNREYIIGYEEDAQVAYYIDTLHAGRGQILTEARNTTTVRPVVHRQDVFTETTDVHFKRDLDDPVRFGIKYILVAEPGPYYDAVLNAYPTMWANGAGFGPMIASFPNSSEHFRIYRVTATVSPLPAD